MGIEVVATAAIVAVVVSGALAVVAIAGLVGAVWVGNERRMLRLGALVVALASVAFAAALVLTASGVPECPACVVLPQDVLG
ncbi:hypothetical protein [Microbacterium sediminis]|uniref:Uncharacterized protein n=1 Tax=Microbacterium sediminis TaxID=904291 RepID=A0A1B9NH45_9MICO|nr:hypothetical protein [Microbacterium sediminis]OCG75900.1 hypothetical protein A7J15_13120 [Microbacterium sediminis]QBR73333.1 hypothetical protein E3O41_02050 [Microbacterium sediminis]